MRLVHDVYIGDAAFAHACTQRRVGFVDLWIERHVEQLAIGRDANTDAVSTDSGAGGIDHFEDEAQAILQVARAVLIGAVVDQWVEELLQQVTIGAVNFHAVETGVDRILRGLGEILDDSRHFFGGERARHGGGHEAGFAVFAIAERNCTLCLFGGGADRCFAVDLDRGMGHAADVPELSEHATADAVDRVGHQLPTLYLLRCIDAWIEQVALAFTGDRRTFRHDQAGGAALGVVQRDLFGGDVLGGTRAGHWCHDDAVVEGRVAEFEFVEQSQGSLSCGGGIKRTMTAAALEGGCQGTTGDASAAAQRSRRSPLATRQLAQQGCCERHHQD